MKIKENCTVYTCDFCKKKLFTKGPMERHEIACSMNPVNNNACSACAFLEETTVEYEDEKYSNEYCSSRTRTTKGFHCSKLNIDLYPHKCITKGLVTKYPEQFEDKQVMPNRCEHWNYTHG